MILLKLLNKLMSLWRWKIKKSRITTTTYATEYMFILVKYR